MSFSAFLSIIISLLVRLTLKDYFSRPAFIDYDIEYEIFKRKLINFILEFTFFKKILFINSIALIFQNLCITIFPLNDLIIIAIINFYLIFIGYVIFDLIKNRPFRNFDDEMKKEMVVKYKSMLGEESLNLLREFKKENEYFRELVNKLNLKKEEINKLLKFLDYFEKIIECRFELSKAEYYYNIAKMEENESTIIELEDSIKSLKESLNKII